jgi:hypothetical protein
MTRRAAQLNIRSDKARQRVADLVYQTGKTATQVVEEAVMAYRPPPPTNRPAVPEGLEWRGRFLVMKPTGGPPITTEQLLQAIDDAREDRMRHILGEDVD